MRQPATFTLYAHKLTLDPGFLWPEAQPVETFLLNQAHPNQEDQRPSMRHGSTLVINIGDPRGRRKVCGATIAQPFRSVRTV